MKSASLLMKNTLLLAASSIVLRLCALCFQAYLASKIGAEQLGIFGIITSVGVVFATISISGVRFSVTRLAAEEVSSGNEYPKSLMCCAFRYAAVFGFCAGVVMYGASGIISQHWIGDIMAAVPLRIMSLSMPAIALGSCIEGYFTAKQKVFRLIAVQIISQLLRIAFVAIMFFVFLERGAFPADILAAASLVGEMSFSAGLFILYFFETFKRREEKCAERQLPKLIKTAAPLAVSAYMRTGLSSLGQIIIPAGLKKAGMGSASAFSTYGIITQMAMPVVMFPAALLGALGEILIPRLTEAQVKNQKIGISYITNRALRMGTMFSFGVMGVMLFFANELGEAIYTSTEAGLYIRIFAPLIPIIYIDSVTDGCLKGLGQQVHSMMYNVLEGILNVVLLFFLLPKAAMLGYIFVMYVKEIFNAVLSIRRLGKVTAVDIGLPLLITVSVCVCGAWLLGNIVVVSGGIILKIVIYCLLYILLLYILNTVTRDDIKWAAGLLNYKKI